MDNEMRPTKILTRSDVLYRKLSELNYKNNVSFEKLYHSKLNSILKNINKNDKIVSMIEKNGVITLIKHKPTIFNVHKY